MHLLEATPVELGQALLSDHVERERKVCRSPETVLLAEDDNDLRYVMELSLSAMGYLVVACADAHLAATAFHAHTAIDILLTDFEMPRRSGVELARELTAIRPSLPVMIITGSILPAATMQEIHDRQWMYVSKPCHLAALQATLKCMVNTGIAAQVQAS